MWVITQEKKDLVKLKRFFVSKNLGGKGKKYVITGFIAHNAIDGGIVCGYYPSEEAVNNELMKIKAFIEQSPEKVYIFE